MNSFLMANGSFEGQGIGNSTIRWLSARQCAGPHCFFASPSWSSREIHWFCSPTASFQRLARWLPCVIFRFHRQFYPRYCSGSCETSDCRGMADWKSPPLSEHQKTFPNCFWQSWGRRRSRHPYQYFLTHLGDSLYFYRRYLKSFLSKAIRSRADSSLGSHLPPHIARNRS